MTRADTPEQLKALQVQMAEALYRPLTSRWRMRKETPEGASMRRVASSFIKPNDRLSSFDRLEIYNRCYWFRILECLSEDYPGLEAILGESKFMKLATAYLERYPSASFTLRDLGSRLEQFLIEEPSWTAPKNRLALDMARFEWAQVVAFDGPSLPPVKPDDMLGADPSSLRLAVQPYVSLLKLEYAVDEYLLAVKNRETEGLRGTASNASNTAPASAPRRRRVSLPKRQNIFLAVHRHDNMLYYKRLEPGAYFLLEALQRGFTLEEACEVAVNSLPEEEIDWSAKIRDWFQNWSELGWLASRPPDNAPES